MATDIERLVVTLEANIKKYEKEMARTRSVTDRALKIVERQTQDSMKRVEGIVARSSARINSAIGGMLAGISIQQVAKLADGYTKVQNSLKVAGLEGQALKSTYDQLFAAAQRQGVPIEDLAVLYGRLSLAQKDLNATAPELMRFTEGVATALRVSGQSSAEASGALLQLSQAMSGGKIQAEEYNSLIDGARPVLQAVAAGLKEAGGSVSQLTALVKDGKVSSEAFFRAFEAGQGILDEMASRTAPTLAQGMTRVYNALTDAAGKMNEAIGATEGFQSAINALVADIGKMPAGLQASIHELERLIQLYGQAKAFAREGLAAVGVGASQNRIDQAFDADSYAVHGSMRGYKPPAAEGINPLSFSVKPRKTVSLSDYPVAGEKDGKGGKSSAERVNELQRETQAIQERTRALEVERTTVGLSAGDTAKAEAAFKLLEAAKQANIDLTPTMLKDIDDMATRYGAATQALEDARKAQESVAEAMRDFQSTAKDAVGSFISDIRRGESAADAFANSLDRIADKLIDMALNSLFSSGTSGGGLGGILSGLFGGKGVSFNPTGRAAGGQVKPGVAYTVGESGRETFVPTRPGRIIPNGRGGGNVVVNITNNTESRVSQKSTKTAGGTQLDVIIDQIAAQKMATPGTASNRAVRTFGAGMPLTRRG